MSIHDLEIVKRIDRTKDPLKKRIYAAKELWRMYAIAGEIIIDWDIAVEALAVIISKDTDKYQKLAARILLDGYFGSKEVNDMIEEVAVVTERNDTLVTRWREKVRKRDVVCQGCGDTEHLEAHHISHWSDDPVNRINPDNGILLCNKCHAKAHPELSETFFNT